jgi:hypothetical protein
MKPQVAAKNSTTIPPLSTPVAQTRTATVAEAARTLAEVLAADSSTGLDNKVLEKITTPLTGYSDTTLERIHNYPWNRTTSNHFMAGIMNTWDETKANDYMAATTALREYEPNGVPPLHYGSWQHYPELHPANNEGDYPEERLSQITALYLVTEHMIAQGEEPYYWGDLTNDIEFIYLDDDDKLRDFLLNPGTDYSRDDITRIITTHHTFDPERIKEMLNLGVQPMTGGVL